MNGRIGPVTVVFGFFVIGTQLALRALFYVMVGAVWVMLQIINGARALIRWRKRRKTLSESTHEEIQETEPPTIIISPVANRKDDGA